MMTERVEKVRTADVDCIKNIELECSLSPWTKADYLEEIDRPDSLFFLARSDSSILGFILARLIMIENPADSFNEIEIYNIGVRKDSRHQKIGSRLMEEIYKSARKFNVYKIHLEVRSSNTAAISFYREHGFGIAGHRRNFYSNPPEDAVLMCQVMDFRKKP